MAGEIEAVGQGHDGIEKRRLRGCRNAEHPSQKDRLDDTMFIVFQR